MKHRWTQVLRLTALLVWVSYGLAACVDEGGGAATTDAGQAADAGDDCASGTEDCRCLMDGTCRLPALTCSAGVCRDETQPCDVAVERCPPAEPRCYSPCQSDRVTDDGAVIVCAPDGLMPGCLPGTACQEGTCAAAAPANAQTVEPGQCGHEADCPDFQACLRGRCYAECEQTAECANMPGNPRTCERRVCREQCGSGAPCTDLNTFCDRGICQPLVPPDAEPTPPPTGAFALSDGSLTFTATNTSRSVNLSNVGSGPLLLTVRKAEQITIADDRRPQRITEQALPWLSLNAQRLDAIELEVPVGETVTLTISGAEDHAFARWTGRLEISGEGLPTQALRLVYSTGLTGRWSGTTFAFGNFGGGAETDAWSADPSNDNPAIPNAFMRVWAQYRNGGVNLAEMGAIVQATLTGAWDQPRVRALCEASGALDDAVCAPFNNANGVVLYTSNVVANPVPSGVVQSAFSMEVATADCDGGACAAGRIDSAVALQYPGDPLIELMMNGASDGCEREDAVQGCVTTLSGFDVNLAISARALGACDAEASHTNIEQPWLVDGFVPPGVVVGDANDLKLVECRGTQGALPEREANARFAEANPVADGRPRRRRLSLVDGLLIEQSVMVLLLRETVDPFHGEGAPLVSYQFVMLAREQSDPADLNPAGNPVGEPSEQRGAQGPICDPDMLQRITGQSQLNNVSPADQSTLAQALLTGGTGGAPAALPAGYQVHSLCIWDEQVGSAELVNEGSIGSVNAEAAVRPGMVRRAVIDAGPLGEGQAVGNRPCFPGAEIIYFATQAAQPESWACNETFQDETCLTDLQIRAARGDALILEPGAATRFTDLGEGARLDLLVRCADGEATCSDHRFDLTAGKTFGLIDDGNTYFAPLDEDVARAFRYKTRFVDRAGTSLGFSPTVCRGDVRPDPYCFDPQAIEQARARVDCLLALLPTVDDANPTLAGLQRIFGAPGPDHEDPILGRGFEDLYAELLIMRGDDALTAAYTTRYAVGTGAAEPFEGDRFEDGGLNLSGVAGAEMAHLYRAVQTYDIALNRFFGLVPVLWANAVAPNEDDRFVTERTVTGWMERIIRASTQRARAYSEIARRYQSFGRSDLALSVIRRAYVRAHQEGLVLTSLINAIAELVESEQRGQIRRGVDQAQVRYRVALLEMAERHAQVISGADLFGFPQGYVPFPALDEDAVNGFEEMLGRAMDRLELASSDEERAIGERREYDSDEAAFRGELVTQRNSYETELGALCGTFLAADGRTYPALERYAEQIPAGQFAAFEGDPCGRLGNGAIWMKAGDLQTRELELTRVRQEARNAIDAMQDMYRTVEQRCGLVQGDAAAYLTAQGTINAIEGGIDGMELAISIVDKLYDFITEATNRIIELEVDDTPYEQFAYTFANTSWVAASGAHFVSTTVLESTILTSRAEIRRKETEYEATQILRECDYLYLERGFEIRQMERDFLLTKLDVLNSIWNVDVELSQLRSLFNERNRLESEWADTEQLAVDAASAQADPTKRIYKNDAIRNAEQSFDVALRAAWQAALTYEYYTGSSYARREALLLARLVERGDINLRRFLEDLREDFYDFEQGYGNPDTRVARISICDDVFRIPRLNAANEPLSNQDRIRACRDQLRDPANLDAAGALRIPFTTDFGQLSPRTVNHKILFVEVGLQGELSGDRVARAYLEADGTGVVTGTDGERRFYTFPSRTAVMNPFFSDRFDGTFGQDADGAITGPTRSIFRSYRFRERPFVQSSWALVLDQRAESVNRDIDLGAIDDIVIDIYYTDFTRDAQ